jgi:hypothetical protein
MRRGWIGWNIGWVEAMSGGTAYEAGTPLPPSYFLAQSIAFRWLIPGLVAVLAVRGRQEACLSHLDLFLF